MLEFIMKNGEGLTSFKSEFEEDDELIIFDDKTFPETKFLIRTFVDEIIVERKGKINMVQKFQIGKLLHGYFEFPEGRFNISAYTEFLSVSDKQIIIRYKNYIEGEYRGINELFIKK